MTAPALSRFTPSLLTHETLEAILVQRHRLVDRLVEVNDITRNDSKHHILLVGPRGIGKTHLVSLLYHRLHQSSDLNSRLLIAWLREEAWGIASYLDLLYRILCALQEEYPDKALEAQIADLTKLPVSTAELAAETHICQQVAGKTLLLIVENLNDVFQGLEQHGQEKLRAFIQNNAFFSIVATSQSLFNSVSLRVSPFYGFFEVNRLHELSLEDAVTMLAKIARHQGNVDLASLIPTAHGRARLRAIHHLVGGNPRLYVVFSRFLSRESLDDLVDPFMQMLDDLTPYYQSKMALLTPQQRKIIDFLCERNHSVAVKDIAQNNFITHQTTSGQLKKLKKMGYVRSIQSGRESLYEMCEPLMRLALALKKQRGGPIRLLVEFLKLWYSSAKLVPKLEPLTAEQPMLQESLNLNPQTDFYRHTNQAVILMMADRWDEGKSVLEHSLRHLADNKDMDDDTTLVQNLLTKTQDTAVWHDHIVIWVQAFNQYGLLAMLGKGLLRSIPIFTHSWLNHETISQWYQTWLALGAEHPELALPLRVLKVAVQYHESQNERVFLNLPVEERQILKPLLLR